MCGQPGGPRSRTEAGVGWRRVWLPQSPRSQSPCPFLLPARTATPGTHKSLLRSSTAPSVTPESRRGHPNCLAEPLAVAPWAVLALPAHARRGLQLLAASLCGPRAGLLMSLALRLRWHWTRKSGPAEGPPEMLPRPCPASDSPGFASDKQRTTSQVSIVPTPRIDAQLEQASTVHALLYAWLWEEARV